MPTGRGSSAIPFAAGAGAAAAGGGPSLGAVAAPPSGQTSDVLLMHGFLTRRRPSTGSEALRLLREAFPAAPLAARVAAVSAYASDD
jgi:hypothetical protein